VPIADLSALSGCYAVRITELKFIIGPSRSAPLQLFHTPIEYTDIEPEK
jgi:hypothetical protein